MITSAFRLGLMFACAVSVLFLEPGRVLCGKFPGEISQVKGDVEIQKAGGTQWYKAVDGLPVQLKDRIKTHSNSTCNLELDDGSLIFVAENTEASVDFIEVSQEKHSSTLALWFGKLLSNIKKTPSTKMRIKCPTAVISVRGTEFAVDVGTQSADVGVFEGEVTVSSSTGLSGEELEIENSTSPVTIALLETSVKPDEETTVGRGEAPAAPRRLSPRMQQNKERLDGLRNRVKELREKLKREKPEYSDRVRQSKLDRVMSLREKRQMLNDKINKSRESLR